MPEKIKYLLVILLLSVLVLNGQGTFNSRASGSWVTATTWTVIAGTDADGIPDADDDITILATHTVSMTGNPGSCNSLTVNGTANWTKNGMVTNVGAGGLTLQSGSITGSVTGVLNVTGGFFVLPGTSTLARCKFTVSGSTSISGQLNITSSTGTKSFNDITVTSTGIWNSTVVLAPYISGSLQNEGTFNANTGRHTFTGTGKELNGNSLTLTSFSVTGSITNNATLTILTRFEGGGTFSQGNSSTLEIASSDANFSVAVFNTSAAGNTVNYNRAGAQSIRVPDDGSYSNLTVSVSGTKTLAGNTTISGNLLISAGTLDVSGNDYSISIAGNWTNTGTFNPRTGTVTFNGTSIQTISNATGESFYVLSQSSASTILLGGPFTSGNDLTINGTLDVSASDYSLTVRRNWINNGTFTARGGTVTFNGSVAQTIGGSVTTSFNNITVSNTSGVSITRDQNLSGTLTISAGTFTTTGFNFLLLSNASGTARIAAITGSGNIAGNITMQRYIATGGTGWRFLTSSVTGATLADWLDDFAMSGFTGSTSPSSGFVSIYTYDESATGSWSNGYIPATNIKNPITPGVGYWAYVGPVPVTIDVTGPPAKFNQSFNLTYTPSNGITEDGWNMVSNPYPSQIDWDAGTGWTKNNIDSAFYIWNPNLQQYASYVNGIGTNDASNIIPSSQAFWVKAKAASPVLSMTENVKSNGSQPFIRTHGNAAKHQRLMLKIKGNGFTDETFVQFDDRATVNFDSGRDAYKLYSNSQGVPSIASLAGTTELSVNSLGPLTASVSIPVKVLVNKSGTYSLLRDSLFNFPLSSCIQLVDLHTGSTIDLRKNAEYSFYISDTTASPRFILKIGAPAEKKSAPVSCAGGNDGLAIVKGSGQGPWKYEWKDESGSILKSSSLKLSEDTLSGLKKGIYRILISDAASMCGVYEDTINIGEPEKLSLSFAKQPVSCFGKNDGKIDAFVNGGAGNYTYTWSTGDTTLSVSALPAGNYFLAVKDQNACTLNSAVQLVQPQPMAAGFAISTDTVYLSTLQEIVFANLSTGISFAEWDFGDSSSRDTSFVPLPHFYETAGSYTIRLLVSNGTCRDSAFKIVNVINDTITSDINKLLDRERIRYSIENEEDDAYLRIFSLLKEELTLSVYSITGQQLSDKIPVPANGEKIRIPIPGAGVHSMYLLLIRSRNDFISIRVIR